MLTILMENYGVLASGLGVTVIVSLTAIAAGGVLGMLFAIGLTARNPLLRAFCKVYRSFWRGTPILVQLLMVFYLLPASGLDVSPLTAAILTLSLNSAAFQAEIFRAGLAAIPRGQVEAGRILGLPRWRIRLTVELPQMFRLVMPALINELISIVKNSSLVSVIAVTELMRRSQQLASATFQPLEVYLIAGLLYIAVNLLLARAGILTERRLAVSGAL